MLIEGGGRAGLRIVISSLSTARSKDIDLESKLDGVAPMVADPS